MVSSKKYINPNHEIKQSNLSGGYTKIPNKVLKSGLSSGAILVYAIILDSIQPDKKFNPSVDYLAKYTDMSIRNVSRKLKELETAKLIKRSRQFNKISTFELIYLEDSDVPSCPVREDILSCTERTSCPDNNNYILDNNYKQDNNYTYGKNTQGEYLISRRRGVCSNTKGKEMKSLSQGMATPNYNAGIRDCPATLAGMKLTPKQQDAYKKYKELSVSKRKSNHMILVWLDAWEEYFPNVVCARWNKSKEMNGKIKSIYNQLGAEQFSKIIEFFISNYLHIKKSQHLYNSVPTIKDFLKIKDKLHEMEARGSVNNMVGEYTGKKGRTLDELAELV